MPAADFLPFALDHLPPAPARVLEVGCGDDGGLVPLLAARGYDVLGVDPNAPAGERFVRAKFEEAAGELRAQTWDVVLAARVLHHVEPLDEGVALLAELAPLLLVDEFAPDRVVGAAQAWYEQRWREVPGAQGPKSIDEWRARHGGLHPHDRVLAALRGHYEEQELEWRPYFHRWLRLPELEAEERAAIEAGEIQAVGWRWAGRVRRRAAASAPSSPRSP
jgi:SAM-dependent methyltransferase